MCNYMTSRLSDITRHNASKSHKIKCYDVEQNLLKDSLNDIGEIERMKLEINSLKRELSMKDETIKLLTEDKQHYKSIVTTVNANNTQSLNTINFLATHRNSAPPLEELTTQTAQLCLEYDNDDLINLCISHQRENVLHTFIGNIIVNCYKKEDPKDQSIWNSDVSRLTFIIRDKVKDINILAKGKNKTKYVNKWIHDKKGVAVNKRVITPILKFLRNTLDNYSKTHGKNICNLIQTDPYKYAEEAEKIGYANKIISTIASGKLARRISTHIGAQFQLNDRTLITSIADASDDSSDESDNNSDSDSDNDSN
jgi:hypothetical protein